MQIVINISEEQMDMVKHSDNAIFVDVYRMMAEVIMNGTPLPQNATNGDVIKAMFPNLEWIGEREDVDFYLLDSETPYAAKLNTFKSWWNAPYKAESEDKK